MACALRPQTARQRAADGGAGTSAGNAVESLLTPFQARKRDLRLRLPGGSETLSKIICAGVAFAIIGKTVIGKSDVGKSKGNKYYQTLSELMLFQNSFKLGARLMVEVMNE